MSSEGPMLSVAQVATLLGKSPGTIFRLAAAGKIPCQRLPGRWREDEIASFIRGNPDPGSPWGKKPAVKGKN